MTVKNEAKSEPAFSILVIRCDRLGDVLLSTPVFSAIKQNFKGARLTVMVQDFVAPVIRGLPEVDEVLIYEPKGRHAGIRGFFRLLGELRARHFRMGILLQSQFRLAAAVFGAGIRYRVGPLSKIYSFFFYNRGLRQRRSRVEMHEADYNLQLLRRIGVRVVARAQETRAAVAPEKVVAARSWLWEQGWDPSSPLIAIHPGMGGSALNWPELHYAELAKALVQEGKTVVLSAGAAEYGLVDRIADLILKPDSSVSAGNERGPGKLLIYRGGENGRNLEDLGALYTHAAVVVAPSTGPLHLAVSLGRPVVTFYPPIRVQSAIRWGPYLKDEERASILVPDNYCGEDYKCRGPVCHYYPCMSRLSVPEALTEVHHQIDYAKNQV
ncbi:MAG: glycosyltransferase family 9 protein [Bdellovibrionales bacterium]|nr:glycosyltransferase family 9 protein [Bdellovibrionales bacterium]